MSARKQFTMKRWHQRNFLKRMHEGAVEKDTARGFVDTLSLDQLQTKFTSAIREDKTILCHYQACMAEMEYGEGVDRRSDPDALTLERLDNKIGHTDANTVLACRNCQCLHGRGDENHVEEKLLCRFLWDERMCSCHEKYFPDEDVFQSSDCFSSQKGSRDGLHSVCNRCHNKIHYAKLHR